MSSAVETSRGITHGYTPGIPRLRFNSLGMTEKLFTALDVFHDVIPHSAAMNMAVDEALLASAAVPSIRFYRWQSPALSFGYFGKFADVAIYAPERDLVRRCTGGGIVFHGTDLTYSIVIPASDPAFGESAMTIYETIHRALAEALSGVGEKAELVGLARCADSRKLSGQRGVPTNNCFVNPVRADVMVSGRKVAGAAQRRTGRGLLQQGSIQNIAVATDLGDRFARLLSANYSNFNISGQILERARQLAQQKYGSDSWLHKR